MDYRPFKALVVGSSPTQPTLGMAWVYILSAVGCEQLPHRFGSRTCMFLNRIGVRG